MVTAVPNSLLAKHWYSPSSSAEGLLMIILPPGDWIMYFDCPLSVSNCCPSFFQTYLYTPIDRMYNIRTVQKQSHFQTPLENPSVQTHLVLLCFIERLCIFGLKSAIHIRYYYYYYYYNIVTDCPPYTRLSTVGDRAFPVADPRIWNSLPQHITSAPSRVARFLAAKYGRLLARTIFASLTIGLLYAGA